MNKKGFTLMELLVAVTVIVVIVGFLIGFLSLSIYSNQLKLQEQQRKETVVINLFNGQELKPESWMLELSPDSQFVHFTAKEWCKNHSIPDEQVDAKVSELVTAFDNAIANIKIKLSLPPAVVIESESVVILPEATFP